MAEDGPQTETETGRLLPEGSGWVPLSNSGSPNCALRPLCTPEKGQKEWKGSGIQEGRVSWWLLGSKSCKSPSSSSGTPEVREYSYQVV